MAILVTGGAGYIGSHTCVELLDAGYEVVVLDNLSNASEKSLERVEALTGKKVMFYKGDILDRDILNKIFAEQKIDSCIHFAGLKAVGESVAKPWEYYNNNIAGTLQLVDVRILSFLHLQLYTEILQKSRLPRTARRDSVQILTAGQSLCLNRFFRIFTKQTTSGM